MGTDVFLTCITQDHDNFTISRDEWFDRLDAYLLSSLGVLTSDWTQGKAPPPWRMKIPHVLGDAWLHIIFLMLSLDDDKFYKASLELDYIIRAVSRGRKEILQSLAPQPLEKLEAVLPFGIASLVFHNLINHGVSGQPDVASIYLEYLKKLVR